MDYYDDRDEMEKGYLHAPAFRVQRIAAGKRQKPQHKLRKDTPLSTVKW